MELVATADVEAGAQPRHGVVLCLLVRDCVVGKRKLHEVIKVDVTLDGEVTVPNVETVARRRARKIDADTLAKQVALCRVQRVRQAV